MKRSLLVFLISIISISIQAQDLKLSWANQLGSIEGDLAFELAKDRNNNTYITGEFSGTVDFDPDTGTFNLTSNGLTDIFILKLDPKGKMLWAKSLGGIGVESVSKLTVNSAGNIIISGGYENTVDFDPGTGVNNLSSNGSLDIFILQLNRLGSFAWARSIGSSSNDVPAHIISDGSNNIYLTGTFQNTVDFNPRPSTNNLTSNGNQDIFILKLNDRGNYLWAKQIGGIGRECCSSLDLDRDENLIVSGGFRDTADFDPSSIGVKNVASNGDFDAFVEKLDQNGNLIWVNTFGSNSVDRVVRSTVDSENNIYCVGTFEDTVDFDPDTTGVYNLISNGDGDAFIQKLDSNGSLIWVKSYGSSTGDDVAVDVLIDSFDDVYSIGNFKGLVDFDPDSIGTYNQTSNARDIFIHKLDKLGNFQWVQTYNATGDEYISALEIDERGSIYTTGFFESTIDINPDTSITLNFTSNGLEDIFVLKYDQCGYYTDSIETEVCGSNYISPSGKNWTQSGTYLDTIFNTSGGCDTLFSIDLTLTDIDTSISVVNNLNIFSNDTLAAYQWLDCNNGNSPIVGDTNRSFVATVNGSYAVALEKNGCADTSACIQVLTVGLNENSEAKNSISLYPNPNNGSFTVSVGPNYLAKTYQILDISGRVVQEAQFTQQSSQIDLSVFGKGVYFMRVIETGWNQKIVVVD